MSESIIAAHSIKGSAANIGLTALSEAAKTIEIDLKSGDTSQVPAKVINLKAAFEDFRVLLNS
jgi:HPt (histidine-containing phosphotransfer) domain-containing protein